jgi:outer membrane lipoprotein-sorting protein
MNFPRSGRLFVAISVASSMNCVMNLHAAAGTTKEEPLNGAALAAELRSLQPATNASFSGLLRIRKADGRSLEVPITLTVLTGAANWSVTYQTAGSDELPVEKLIVLHSADQPNRYSYARASQRGEPLEAKPVSGEQLLTPLADSTFCLLDLGLEFFHWPQQRLLKRDRPELYKSRPCHVLESLDPAPLPRGYARVLSWVDKETGGLLKAEAYDRDNHLLKEFSVRSIMKVENQWQPQELKICAAKSGACTWIKFDP